ncbi:MAG: MarR family winged helix-turn-helix transcriptional regulator [Pseudomonadales bacterium]
MTATSPERFEQAYRLFNEINIIAQLSSNEMARVLPHGLTLSQFSVLNWFARVDDEATPGRLAAAFQVTKGAMTNTLQKLQQKGFIEVTGDPTSGRRKLVRMTGSGRRARNAAIAATYPILEAFLAHFGDAATSAMLPQLEAIRSYLDQKREGEH